MCNKRIRDIDPKEFSKSGRFVSEKQKRRVIEFESELEQDFIHLLEFDSNVSKYVEQPFRIKYYLDGKERHYFPDFYVEFRDKSRKPELFEVKYSFEVDENSPEFQAKNKAAEIWANDTGMIFKVITELEIRSDKIYLDNIKLLGRYLNALDPYCLHGSLNFDDKHMLGIYNKIEAEGPKTIDEYVREYSLDDEIRYEVFFNIFYLIASKHVSTDLLKPLTKESTIWAS